MPRPFECLQKHDRRHVSQQRAEQQARGSGNRIRIPGWASAGAAMYQRAGGKQPIVLGSQEPGLGKRLAVSDSLSGCDRVRFSSCRVTQQIGQGIEHALAVGAEGGGQRQPVDDFDVLGSHPVMAGCLPHMPASSDDDQ